MRMNQQIIFKSLTRSFPHFRFLKMGEGREGG